MRALNDNHSTKMGDIQQQKKFTVPVTFIRLRVTELQQQSILTSRKWLQGLATMKSYRTWWCIAAGKEVDQPCKVVLIIGWKGGTEPPERYRSNLAFASDPSGVLAHIREFVCETPEVCTFWHSLRGDPNLLTTMYRGGGLRTNIAT
ncbi:hypothetical protein F5Y15DRAFT_222046 [Xylariaceae sp. FL0016]|nr:hypothetical protein F5Y15DRAFT_222046 [Xylariaceae sp. FL0016]